MNAKLDVIMEDYATSLQEKVDEQITQPIGTYHV